MCSQTKQSLAVFIISDIESVPLQLWGVRFWNDIPGTARTANASVSRVQNWSTLAHLSEAQMSVTTEEGKRKTYKNI